MNKLSVMTLGFLKDTVVPYMADRDGAKLKERFKSLFTDISSAGFEAIDIASFEVRLVGDDYIADLCKTYGLKVASLIHTGRYADADVAVAEHVADAKAAVSTAIKLGARTFMIVPSVHPGIEKMQQSEIFSNIVANAKPIVDYAMSCGLTVLVEDYPDPSLYLSSQSQLDELLSNVEGLKLVYDSANMITADEDPIKYAEHFNGEIGHVHIKDIEITSERTQTGERTLDGRKIRTVFVGTGEVDIPKVIRTLISSGYAGYLTIEFGTTMKSTRNKALLEAKKYVTECVVNAQN